MALPSPTEPEGPIIDIFKSLIENDMRNIVLTNEPIFNILQKEFYMDIASMQKFESEMYVAVMKKYLKSWPYWDSFCQTLNKLKQKNDHEGITKILKIKYVEIKEYLSGMLDIAQALASDKLKEHNKLKKKLGRDVIMEVKGSAQQLRSLFYRCPVNGSIFNTKKAIPSIPIPRKLTFESIINWFDVDIEMVAHANNKTVLYKRKNLHKLTHRLLNKKLREQMLCQPDLKSHILVRSKDGCINVSRDEMMKHFRRALSSDSNTKWSSVSDILKKVIDDLCHLPDLIDISCDYRRHISERKYVRYFTQEALEGDYSDKYDLHLEEVVSPLCEYNFTVSDKVANSREEAITLTCTYCQITFIGMDCLSDILRHFSHAHMAEPDWKCLKCSKVFTMCSLTQSAWTHTCDAILCL